MEKEIFSLLVAFFITFSLFSSSTKHLLLKNMKSKKYCLKVLAV
ncbi:hypothetical protein [Bacillus sp. BA3]|nr:hypothetical protein [Bacillus sp. BA3]